MSKISAIAEIFDIDWIVGCWFVIILSMETKTRIAGIFIQNGKMLMLTGKGYPELWTPGGKVDERESDEETLRRELKEELDVDLVSFNFFKEYLTENFYSQKYKIIERVYTIIIKGEPKPNAEIENVVWFTKEDFQNKKFPMIPHTEEELIPDLIKAGIW